MHGLMTNLALPHEIMAITVCDEEFEPRGTAGRCASVAARW